MFKEILTTYWAQATFILTAVGIIIFYWIKRHYDFKSKKDEIKFNLYYGEKIKIIKAYYEGYGSFLNTMRSVNASYINKTLTRDILKDAYDKWEEFEIIRSQIGVFSNTIESEKTTALSLLGIEGLQLLLDDVEKYMNYEKTKGELKIISDKQIYNLQEFSNILKKDFGV